MIFKKEFFFLNLEYFRVNKLPGELPFDFGSNFVRLANGKSICVVAPICPNSIFSKGVSNPWRR